MKKVQRKGETEERSLFCFSPSSSSFSLLHLFSSMPPPPTRLRPLLFHYLCVRLVVFLPHCVCLSISPPPSLSLLSPICPILALFIAAVLSPPLFASPCIFSSLQLPVSVSPALCHQPPPPLPRSPSVLRPHPFILPYLSPSLFYHNYLYISILASPP